MDLIKTNKQKKRSVYKGNGYYRKLWHFVDIIWLDEHVKVLNNIVPNYVVDYGHDEESMWLDTKEIEGVPASTLEHTPEFIAKVYKFCLENIEQTLPYVHGDWVLSNIIVNGENMFMIDWDNCNVYPKHMVIEKMKKDLHSAFGDKFDPSSI
ncbi:MAG: RIO1 family regulatory kinase/ATPase [Euryarchaeota archaeon]|jgi:RIO-like serine/threonine protein kinase